MSLGIWATCPSFTAVQSARAESLRTEYSVLKDSALADCTAVKEGHVAQIPSDIEALDSPVPASFLGSYYVASILHPEVVTEEDFAAAEKDFYETFYGFTPESAD